MHYYELISSAINELTAYFSWRALIKRSAATTSSAVSSRESPATTTTSVSSTITPTSSTSSKAHY